MSVETLTIEDQNPVDLSEPKIELEEIAELEAPIKKIIEKIKDRIENGEYGLVIGDDASGRIPARILGGFIKEIMGARGMDEPNLVFIPGKLKEDSVWQKILKIGHQSHQELEEYLDKNGATKEKKILIVTDTLQSGMSLKTLVDLLRQTDYKFEIATIGIEQPMIGKKFNQNLPGIDFVSGEYRSQDYSESPGVPSLYNERSKKLSGVYKNPGDQVSKPFKSLFKQDQGEIQKSINQSRQDAKTMISHLIDWYESQRDEE